MRVWIDPGRAAALDLTAGEIVAALRAQNVQVAAGSSASRPTTAARAFQLNVETQGRFTDPQQFANIVIRTDPDGRRSRVCATSRASSSAPRITASTPISSGKPTRSSSAIIQRPGSNALAAAEAVQAEMDDVVEDFPKGLEYRVIYNPTEFISQSIDAVQHTLFEAVLLVVLVVLVFLQSWRAAIIPIVAIPVSLIGTFAVLAALGYSLNNLSLFGLVLAIGIVVDDAIVVVENVERNLEHGLSPARGGAHARWTRCRRALVAIVLVLCAVFVPTLFLTGIPGEFYQQFAVTISAATVISLILSLTLSPALAALLLQAARASIAPTAASLARSSIAPAIAFNRGFERLSDWLCRAHRRMLVAPPKRDAGDLCRADRADRRRVLDDADRLHPGAGPGLCSRRRSSCRRAPRSSAPTRCCKKVAGEMLQDAGRRQAR